VPDQRTRCAFATVGGIHGLGACVDSLASAWQRSVAAGPVATSGVHRGPSQNRRELREQLASFFGRAPRIDAPGPTRQTQRDAPPNVFFRRGFMAQAAAPQSHIPFLSLSAAPAPTTPRVLISAFGISSTLPPGNRLGSADPMLPVATPTPLDPRHHQICPCRGARACRPRAAGSSIQLHNSYSLPRATTGWCHRSSTLCTRVHVRETACSSLIAWPLESHRCFPITIPVASTQLALLSSLFSRYFRGSGIDFAPFGIRPGAVAIPTRVPPSFPREA